MYFHPKDGYPEVKTYKGFSVGDIVEKRQHFSTLRGYIVRIYQPPFDKTPYIVVTWFGNGAVGIHAAENLKRVMTEAQWLAHVKAQREQEERDKAQGRELLNQAKAERARKRFRDVRRNKAK